MELHFDQNAPLTVALAAGMLGQAIARHARMPSIVLLLVLGGVLGPDLLGVVQPEALGDGLQHVVGFAVAIILFEGGMSLDVRRLRRAQRPIRQLVTVGALVSLLSGAVLAAVALGWGWKRSLLFGTLAVVTGPTVVTPLLRRLRIDKTVSTVLEAEGVFVDAVGAITAAVALELVLRPTGESIALAAPTIAVRLGAGIAVGVVGGGGLALLLRVRNVVPEGLENPFTLGWAVLTFQVANALVHESGIAAAIAAGLVVGNSRTHMRHELQEFKEQLTVMLIGMLFVLLVADVRVSDVVALGWPGVAVAVGCIAVVRPLSVWAGTAGTTLERRERFYIAWMGPRGIVAAAVASLFGYELEEAGIPGGVELRALVFLVIAWSVFWAAATGGVVARLLRLRRRADDGWVLLGGNALARELGALLHASRTEVVVIASEREEVPRCEERRLRVIHGNPLEERSSRLAQLETRTGAVCLTASEERNYLFADKARLRHKALRFAVGLTSWVEGLTPAMVEEMGGEVLFGAGVDVAGWARRLEAERAAVRWFRFEGRGRPAELRTEDHSDPGYVPLLHRRRRVAEPVTSVTQLRPGSEVALVVDLDRADAVEARLESTGWAGFDPSVIVPRPKGLRGLWRRLRERTGW